MTNFSDRERVFVESVLRLIAERGLTQKDLAEKAKINVVTLNRILNFKQAPGKKAASAIAEALSVSVAQLETTDPPIRPSRSIAEIADIIDALQVEESESVIEAIRGILRLTNAGQANAKSRRNPA